MNRGPIRRTVAAIGAATLLLASLAGQALAHPPDTHLHCLTTASGDTHSIARGVTLMAPDDPAFHNFHNNVHFGPFNPILAEHPLGVLAPDFGPIFECP